ncbi:hypothetical protein E2C01_003677 [Portunus trituberculatus]|uniref:Uncharacterized protein n=1 Tax=Portunus trituberculatus TaxID=210409 RepID=A0A5B7CPA4_PORTR|nr:hypothetical protein [Portunus trituberculatus]
MMLKLIGDAHNNQYECSLRMQNFGTHANHTMRNNSKIAGQDSRLCAFVSRDETFLDRTDLTTQLSLTHSLSSSSMSGDHTVLSSFAAERTVISQHPPQEMVASNHIHAA